MRGDDSYCIRGERRAHRAVDYNNDADEDNAGLASLCSTCLALDECQRSKGRSYRRPIVRILGVIFVPVYSLFLGRGVCPALSTGIDGGDLVVFCFYPISRTGIFFVDSGDDS